MTDAGTRRRIVVVGNGMAGLRFVQDLVAVDHGQRFQITVIGEEPGAAYNRILLSNLLAGRTTPADVVLASESWYADHDIALVSGVRVDRLDRATRQVRLADGRFLDYDTLVLATGSEAVRPAFPGLIGEAGVPVEGAVAFRTLDDCIEIDRLAERADHAVVVGAGVLGIEAARALAGRGLDVTLLSRGDRLMERQLDDGASRLMARAATGLGISLRSGGLARVVSGHGHIQGVVLESGATLPTDLLVLCCGVRPRIELAQAAGLSIERGIVVDDRLRSVSDPRIFAIGECAEHRGRLYGLVAPVWEQARVAALAVLDESSPVVYSGSPEVVRLKAAGIELACLGDSTVGGADDDIPEGTDVVRYVDTARGIYHKLVVRNDRLAGAIVLGDTRVVGTLTQLFDRQTVLPADRAPLLIVRRNGTPTVVQSPTLLPGRATICQCNGVTKSAICSAWSSGARSVVEIADATRATTGCGTCRDTVEGLLEWLDAADAGATEDMTGQRDPSGVSEAVLA